MSERINVDQAFDPEARKAQAELDAYMDSRPYRDEKGNVHAAQGGKFIKADKHHNTLRDDYYTESLEQGDYSNESLDQLAKRVADARAEGDRTRANDAEEAFFNKFAEYSEKYGWEDEDGSADGPHVSKDVKLGRSTIDDRLDRYSKIMYGEDADNTPTAAPESEQVADNQPEVAEVPADQPQSQVDSYIPKRRGEYKDETETPIYDEVMAKHRAESAEQNSEESESAGFDVNAEVEAAKAKLAEDAAHKEAEAVAAINETDQAKADRELLDGSKNESDEKDTGASDLEIIGDSPVVSASDLEMLPEDNMEETAPRSRSQRIRDVLSPVGAGAEIGAWAATRERGGHRNRIAAALGGAALLIGGGLLLMKGHDIFGSNGGHGSGSGNGAGFDGVGNHGAPGANTHEVVKHAETVRVNAGDGEIKVTQRILENHGVHVNTTEAQQIGEHAGVHDILKGDDSYTHSGSTMDRIGETGKFKIRKGVTAKLLSAAKQLKLK